MKKIAASVLLLCVVVGAGTTYAISDVTTAISAWFQASFLEKSSELETATTNEINSSLERFSTDIQHAAKQAEEQIRQFQIKMTADSAKSMEEHRGQYIRQLQETKENLKKQKEQELRLYKEQAKAREMAQITQDTEDILAGVLEEQK